MSALVIVVAVVIFLFILIGIWYFWSTPAPEPTPVAPIVELPPVPVNPLEVNDLVQFEWQPPDTATDLCAPSKGKSIAYGAVKKVDGMTVSVRWMIIKNPYGSVKYWPCCWKRSLTDNAWNMKYWGDENTDPTYNSGLKSVNIHYEDLQKLSTNFWLPEHSCDKEEAIAAAARLQAQQAFEASGPLFNCPVDYVQNWQIVVPFTGQVTGGVCPGEWGCCNRLEGRRLPPGHTWAGIANTDIGRPPF